MEMVNKIKSLFKGLADKSTSPLLLKKINEKNYNKLLGYAKNNETFKEIEESKGDFTKTFLYKKLFVKGYLKQEADVVTIVNFLINKRVASMFKLAFKKDIKFVKYQYHYICVSLYGYLSAKAVKDHAGNEAPIKMYASELKKIVIDLKNNKFEQDLKKGLELSSEAVQAPAMVAWIATGMVMAVLTAAYMHNIVLGYYMLKYSTAEVVNSMADMYEKKLSLMTSTDPKEIEKKQASIDKLRKIALKLNDEFEKVDKKKSAIQKDTVSSVESSIDEVNNEESTAGVL